MGQKIIILTPNCKDIYQHLGTPSGSVVKNLPASEKTWVHFLGWEDPLEKEMVTLENPVTEKLGGLQSTGRKESDTTERLHFIRV